MPTLSELRPDTPPARREADYETRELAAMKKGAGSAIAVRELRRGSERLIDIRVHFYDRRAGEWKPTKKGLAVTPEQFRELRELLASIQV